MVVFCNPWLSKNIVNWGQYLNFVQYYFVGQLYFDHCTQKFKCVLNILFDKQNNLYQRGFLGSAMFNIENTQPSRRWQTLHIIYGNIPRSVSENVLENNIFFLNMYMYPLCKFTMHFLFCFSSSSLEQTICRLQACSFTCCLMLCRLAVVVVLLSVGVSFSLYVIIKDAS